MKIIAIGSAALPPGEREYWGRIVAQHCSKVKWYEALNEKARPFVICTFDTSDPRYTAFLTILEERGIEWSERIEHAYTSEELRSFPFVNLEIERALIAPGGPSHGTTFDLSKGCPDCGCGAVQTSPFYAPPKSFPKTGLICQSSSEKFIAKPVVDAFRRAEVTGVELRQVLSYRDRAPLPWWQIIPHVTMPKMSSATQGIVQNDPPPVGEIRGEAVLIDDRPCPKCRRDGHFHTTKAPPEIFYNRDEVDADELPDVVATWESFGISGIDKEFRYSRFTDPLLLIKPAVFDILRELKVKHARFNPVRIE